MRADDVVGLPVSIAKWVRDLAGPGEVFVSEVVKVWVPKMSSALCGCRKCRVGCQNPYGHAARWYS